MPDLSLPAPEGGFDRAWAGARRRRRLQVGTVAGAGLSVVLVLALWPQGGGLASLRQQDVSGGGVVATTDPTASPTPGDSPSADPSATPTPDASASAGTVGDTTPTPDPSAVEMLPPDGPPRTYTYTVTRDEVGYNGKTAACVSNDTFNTPTGWCVQFPGPFTTRVGQSQPYRALLCRLTGFPSAPAYFYGTGADFSVGRASRTEWTTASADETPAANSGHTVTGGRCLRWSVTWDTRDLNGDLLPASSDYSLDATLYAGTEPVIGASSASATFLSNSFVIRP